MRYFVPYTAPEAREIMEVLTAPDQSTAARDFENTLLKTLTGQEPIEKLGDQFALTAEAIYESLCEQAREAARNKSEPEET